jgi:hypothetical protein
LFGLRGFGKDMMAYADTRAIHYAARFLSPMVVNRRLPHRFLGQEGGPFRPAHPAHHFTGIRKRDGRYSSRREPPCTISTEGTYPVKRLEGVATPPPSLQHEK